MPIIRKTTTPVTDSDVQHPRDILGGNKARIFPVLNFFFVFCYWNYVIYLPLYLQGKGIGSAGIGSLISLFPLMTLVLIFPLGVLADRVSARSILVIGAIGVIFFGPFMFKAQTLALMAAAMIFGGAALTLYLVGINALFFKHTSEEGRGMRTAWFAAGGTLGFGFGPLLGGFLVQYINIESIFVEGTAAGVAMLVLAIFAPTAPLFKIKVADYLKDLRSPAALLVTAIMLVIYTHLGVEQVGFALLMTHVAGMTGGEMGVLFAILAIWSAFWSLMAGRYYDVGWSPVKMLGASVLWSGIFQYITAYASGLGSMAAIRVAHTLGDGFFNIITLALVGSTFPRARVGGNYGFILMVNTAAVFIALNASGLLMRGGRYGLPFQASGMVMIAGGAIFLIFGSPIRKALKFDVSSR